MAERWRVIASLLSEEFGLEVQPSHEGWGAGYDPRHLSLLESWALGEVEEVPEEVKRPKGVVFDIRELSGREEGFAVAFVGHEIAYLLKTPFPNWRHGQREVLRAGYPPASFTLLLAVLESLRAAEILSASHPSRRRWLGEKMDASLPPREIRYPHQSFVRSLINLWLKGREGLPGSVREYLREEDPMSAYDVLMEEIWSRYRPLVDRSRELNRIDLLLDEAGGGSRRNVHRGRIMTDLLRKLPSPVQEILHRHRSASDMSESERSRVLRALSAVPPWMREYLEQMSFLDLTERDLSLLRSLLPRTLEVDVEHRGFITFLFRSWEGRGSGARTRGKDSLPAVSYREILRNVLPHVEHFRRRFSAFLPAEEERWGGSYPVGKRLDHRKLSREVPTGRGKFYKRREVPIRQKLAFELLIDLSSSMRRDGRIGNALRALVLVCEVLHSLDMPFSVKVFNDRVFTVKDFDENYRSVRSRIVSLTGKVGGGTDLSAAILSASESLTLYTKKANLKGVIVLFTDGAPTRGLKGEELKKLIRETKRRIPLVGVGVGSSQVREFFEGTAVSVSSVSRLPSAFAFVLENRLRRIFRNR